MTGQFFNRQNNDQKIYLDRRSVKINFPARAAFINIFLRSLRAACSKESYSENVASCVGFRRKNTGLGRRWNGCTYRFKCDRNCDNAISTRVPRCARRAPAGCAHREFPAEIRNVSQVEARSRSLFPRPTASTGEGVPIALFQRARDNDIPRRRYFS